MIEKVSLSDENIRKDPMLQCSNGVRWGRVGSVLNAGLCQGRGLMKDIIVIVVLLQSSLHVPRICICSCIFLVSLYFYFS